MLGLGRQGREGRLLLPTVKRSRAETFRLPDAERSHARARNSCVWLPPLPQGQHAPTHIRAGSWLPAAGGDDGAVLQGQECCEGVLMSRQGPVGHLLAGPGTALLLCARIYAGAFISGRPTGMRACSFLLPCSAGGAQAAGGDGQRGSPRVRRGGAAIQRRRVSRRGGGASGRVELGGGRGRPEGALYRLWACRAVL